MKGDFLHGDLSVVDFEFYEIAQILIRVDEKLMKNYPKLKQVLANFEQLKGVKEMIHTEEFKKLLFMPPMYVAEGFK